jgi:flagellar hook-associated protein 1
MSGSFQGIHISSSALRNMQMALDTIGHNIANVNTQGYSRQRVSFKTLPPSTFFQNGRQAIGTGVTLAGIDRARDMFLEQRVRTLQGDLGRTGTLATNLSAIEGVYQEPSDSGISRALTRFFDGWSALGSRPDDPAAKSQVAQAGQMLTDRIRTAARELQSLGDQNTAQIGNTFDQIDRIASTIAQLNNQIQQFAGQGTPNDLMDQRDVLVRDLSDLVDVRVETFQDGSYSVYAAGFTLVEGAHARPMPRAYDINTQSLTFNGASFPVRGGQLAGQFQTAQAVSRRASELDTLANELRTQINTLHRQGQDANGNTNVDFFDPLATGAMAFDLSAAVKSSSANVMASVTGNASDGGLALNLAALRETSMAGLGNRTFDGYYEAAVNQAATEASYFAQARDTSDAMMTQVSAQQEAVSGVSLDEEMADMLRFQRSYQAAARALTVFDQMTEDVINMLRR